MVDCEKELNFCIGDAERMRVRKARRFVGRGCVGGGG